MKEDTEKLDAGQSPVRERFDDEDSPVRPIWDDLDDMIRDYLERIVELGRWSR